MQILILYRSFHGTTKHAAEGMAEGLRSAGHEAKVQDVRAALPDLAGVEGVIIGAPTRFGRVSWRAKAALRRIARRRFGQRPVAVFDTYGPLPKTPREAEESRKWLKTGAAGILRAMAQGLGLNVQGEVLRCAGEGRVRASRRG